MKAFVRDNSLSALLVGEYDNDRKLVHDVFSKLGWQLFEAPGRRRAMQCLDRNSVQVVLTSSDAPDWNWKSVLSDLRGLAHPPQLIVTSRLADGLHSLWAEVLNVGGYDVLAQPLDSDEVERVIAGAHRQFDRQPIRAVQRIRAAGAA
jgi:DNA-binding response OmpR family regulator